MPSLFQPLVCIVDFHHARGPEIEQWFGLPDDEPSSVRNDSSNDDTSALPKSLNITDAHLIPYMALPDGAHQSEEEFSYFSLVHRGSSESETSPGVKGGQGQGQGQGQSVFGIACARQLDASQLVFRPAEVTRSAVQKAVVVITSRPQTFSMLREKLRVVTRAWFAQKDFRDREILQHFQESLVKDAAVEPDEQYFGLSLREVIHTFRWQTLVLFKALLLQPKILFFGSQCERICQVQFSLLSLIPGLVRNLQDCADPQMDRYAETLSKPDGVRTSDRSSLLAYMGIPLQIFGKGSIFGPYTPLQQLDTLTDQGTTSYVVGSTNNLLLSQKERYCDVLVNLDEDAVTILSPHLRPQLALSSADRRWIDFLTQAVNDTWDEADPSRPSTHGYAGSEEFIRMQFEEYLLAMLSSAKYHDFLSTHKTGDPKALLADVDGDPSAEFVPAFLEAWRTTHNHALWSRITDPQLFDIVEPRHPCAGGLTIEDVQRRLSRQVAELHLDERFSQTRDVVGRRLAGGRDQVTSAFNKVWADIEVMREAQRKRSEDASSAEKPADTDASGVNKEKPTSDQPLSQRFSRQDLQQAQASVTAASQRAGAYLSSWGAWASEKRKTGWRAGSTTLTPADVVAAGGRESLDQRPRVTTVSELAHVGEEGEQKEKTPS